jgi:hypothetical protein
LAAVTDHWQNLLVVVLALNAVLGLGYRVLRLTRGGPMADVTGGAILAALLVVIAWGAAVEAPWSRWAAAVYALVFGLVVTPLWILAVFIPMRPGAVDKAYIVLYWGSLLAIALAALLAA